MGMPEARNEAKVGIMPDGPATKALMEVMMLTQPGFLYGEKRYAEGVNNTKNAEDYAPVKKEINKLWDILLKTIDTKSRVWPGKPEGKPLPPLDIFNENISAEAIQSLLSELSAEDMETVNIVIDFAMNKKGELVLGKSIDGQELSETMSGQIEDVFSAFTVKNGNTCENGTVYESDSTGSPKIDKNGKPIIVNSEVYAKKLEEEFPAYVEEKTGGKVSVTVNNRTAEYYPDEKAEKVTSSAASSG